MSPKINKIGFGDQGHVPKSRHHRNKRFWGSPTTTSKSYDPKLEQNNTTEFSSISFPYIYYSNGQRIANKLNISLPGFSGFPIAKSTMKQQTEARP